MAKNPPANAGDVGSIPGLGRLHGPWDNYAQVPPLLSPRTPGPTLHSERRPRGEKPVQFLISIPKKRIRKAVGRVTLRRRVRESYRLNRRQLLQPELDNHGLGVDIAFVYLDTSLAPYSVINEKMTSLLQRIAQAASEQVSPSQEEEK